MRLIDADKLLEENTWEWFDDWGNYTAAGQAIADAPTAYDVDKVVELLKYYLNVNEDNGVVYIPKFIIEKLIKDR